MAQHRTCIGGNCTLTVFMRQIAATSAYASGKEHQHQQTCSDFQFHLADNGETKPSALIALDCAFESQRLSYKIAAMNRSPTDYGGATPCACSHFDNAANGMAPDSRAISRPCLKSAMVGML